MPLYWAGNDVLDYRHSRANVASLSRLTVSNLQRGSQLLWLPFCATAVFTAYSVWVIAVHCQVRGRRRARTIRAGALRASPRLR